MVIIETLLDIILFVVLIGILYGLGAIVFMTVVYLRDWYKDYKRDRGDKERK